ncbi:MAG: glycerate kinase [Syntrophobacteraceae bacterium]
MASAGKTILERVFYAGLRAVDPGAAVWRHVRRMKQTLWVGYCAYDLECIRRVVVVGAGKGAAPMARALEGILGDRLTGGVVVVKYGHKLPLERIRILEAGHPLPDENGLKAAEAVLHELESRTEEDLVLGVFSGGASALLPAPRSTISLEDKQATTQLLLECGATIHEINTIRKHLSRLKGGGLALAAHPATVVSLFLSDVVGDPLDVIASGPTVADPTTFDTCIDIMERYSIASNVPCRVLELLERGLNGKEPETVKPGHPALQRVQNVLVGNNRSALFAARDEAMSLGYKPLVLTSQLQGEAREAAGFIAAVAREILASDHPVHPPVCLLAGGEPTVTVKGHGKGGRAQELALAAAIALDGFEGVSLLCAGTDGTDGPTDAAGAFADGTTCGRARQLGLDPADHLARNDSYPFFEALGDLFVSGPTRTNVMDLVCMVVERR